MGAFFDKPSKPKLKPELKPAPVEEKPKPKRTVSVKRSSGINSSKLFLQTKAEMEKVERERKALEAKFSHLTPPGGGQSAASPTLSPLDTERKGITPLIP